MNRHYSLQISCNINPSIGLPQLLNCFRKSLPPTVRISNYNFVLSKFYHSPTDAQVIVLKNNIKIYIKITLKCFDAVTPSSGSSLSVLAKVTLC